MITIAATTEMYIDLWCSVATAGWLVGCNAMLQSRRQRIGVVDHAGGESANLRNLPALGVLASVSRHSGSGRRHGRNPGRFRGRRGNGGIHCRAPSACESFARKAATREAWHYVSFHPRPAAEMQYFRSDTGLGAERDWERFEAAAGHVIRAGRTTMSLIVAGGSDVGSHMPPNRAFSLGGLLLTGRGACLCLLDGASPVPPAPC